MTISLSDFPEEILLAIFNHLPVRNRLQLQFVCRQWNRLLFDDLQELTVGRRHPEPFANITSPFHYLNGCPIDKLLNDVITVIKQANLVKFALENVLGSQTYLFPDTRKLHGEIFDELIQSCPDLTDLTFGSCNRPPFNKILPSLGPQLEQFNANEVDNIEEIASLHQLILEHLNPNKLIGLSLIIAEPKQLVNLVSNFPLLSRLELKFKTSRSPYDTSLPGYDFSCLHQLTKLKFLSLGYQIHSKKLSSAQFESLANGPLSKSLHTLSIGLSSVDTDFNLFQEFTSLKRLNPNVDPTQLAIITQCLPQLKTLWLDACFFNKLDDSLAHNLFECQLNNLTSLTVCGGHFEKECLFFSRISPMRSLTHLEWTTKFHYVYRHMIPLCIKEISPFWEPFLEIVPHKFPSLVKLSIPFMYSNMKLLFDCINQLDHLQQLQLFLAFYMRDLAQIKLVRFCDQKKILLHLETDYLFHKC